MPVFVQVLLWVAAGLTAIGVIWKTVAKPILLGTIKTQVTLPVINAVVFEFKDDFE